MNDVRKKSPRAPTMALADAIERVDKVYEQEGRHAVPADSVAQALGYKNSTNGAAAQAIASLRYYGLLDRPKEGFLAVSKDFESYKFNPDESQKRSLLVGWLRTPKVFADLLDKYVGRLPSEATIRYDLISFGFIPSVADGYVSVFRRSVDFARFYEISTDVEFVEQAHAAKAADLNEDLQAVAGAGGGGVSVDPALLKQAMEIINASNATAVLLEQKNGGNSQAQLKEESDDVLRVPVRLAKGRCAWLELPVPFFESDKERLKKYIDMQFTDDDSNE